MLYENHEAYNLLILYADELPAFVYDRTRALESLNMLSNSGYATEIYSDAYGWQFSVDLPVEVLRLFLIRMGCKLRESK